MRGSFSLAQVFLLTVAILFSVGNIPYEQTEEQLIEVFSEVGPVVSFRWEAHSTSERILYSRWMFMVSGP